MRRTLFGLGLLISLVLEWYVCLSAMSFCCGCLVCCYFVLVDYCCGLGFGYGLALFWICLHYCGLMLTICVCLSICFAVVGVCALTLLCLVDCVLKDWLFCLDSLGGLLRLLFWVGLCLLICCCVGLGFI